MTTGEISAHFAEIYGASVSKETISRITDKVIEEMTDWANRALNGVYAAIFIDAIVVKVRDGQVANRPIYAAIGVSLAGEKDVLGLWAGTGGEGAKFWLSVLTDLKNRGVNDVFFLVCDGLKGLPDVVSNVWPLTTVQSCIIHLIRNVRREAPGLPNGGGRPSSPVCRSRPVKLGQPDPGSAGEGGSSPDEVGSCQHCQMVRARRVRREGAREEPAFEASLSGTGSNLADLGRGASPFTDRHGEPLGGTTPTDTRSQRSRTSRRGGQLLTRARGPLSKNGLPIRVPRGAPVPDGHTVCPAIEAKPAEQHPGPRLFSYQIRTRSSR